MSLFDGRDLSLSELTRFSPRPSEVPADLVKMLRSADAARNLQLTPLGRSNHLVGEQQQAFTDGLGADET